MTLVAIPKRIGYANGSLKGLYDVLTDLSAAIDNSTGSVIGCTASVAELNLNDGAVAGTAVASKTLALGASKDVDTLDIVAPLINGVALTATAAQLNKNAGVTAGTAKASSTAVLGANKNLDVLGLPVGGLKIGVAGAEVATTVSAAELNSLTASGATAAKMAAIMGGTYGPVVYDTSHTLAQVNAGATCVTAVAGKRFIVQDAWMEAVGADPAACTLIRLVEETSNAVIMSHVVADFASNVVVGKTGGTVVTTKLNTPLVANKAVKIGVTGDACTTVTSIRVIVIGVYV